ncbi:uncharacterized protein si:cabz01007807.1 isoform X1 [Tachysurus vachellii]|uniref:uncharacterized protein si:cabz01007807.1 isoform X1 n=1 Tax=Tachysurus vachellii TaxID=175792 RepID=UPI00296ACCF7|nr:uncharacterized protein si:cabz01007807.1 isoform X1 [Tachysurus vachellii]
MEVRDDHVGRQNELASGERQLNGCLKSLNPFLHQAQTADNGLGSTDTNPFFTQGKDANGNTVFRDNNKDFILRHGLESNVWSHFPTSSTTSLENDWAVFPPPTLSQKTNHTTFPNQTWDIGQVTHSATTSAGGLSEQKSNMFKPFKEETSASQRMVADDTTSKERDYLLEFILANQKNDEKSISSSAASSHMEVSEDSSSFLPAPCITSDIFTNTAASQSSDIFHAPESSVQNRVFQKIQLFQNTTSVQNCNPNLSDNFTVHNGQFKPQDSHFSKMVLSTDLSHGIFQETSTLPSHLNSPTNGDLMFKRRPPKPAPRIKAPKNPDQSIHHDIFSAPAVSETADRKLAQTLFTSKPANPFSLPTVQRAKSNSQGTTISDELKSNQVYEDILFIGQEKCVEDWPEDSPELSPDWKPSGKLKLRRESLRIHLESEAALNADTLGKKSSKKKKKMSILRKGSTDKSGDDSMVLQIDTVRPESKEKYPDSLNGAYGDAMPFGTKYNASDDVFLPEEEEQNTRIKSQSMKSKMTKFVVPHLKYRGSKKKSLGDVFENASPFLQDHKSEQILESYEDKLWKRNQKDPMIKDYRMKEKMKLKLSLSHRKSEGSIEELKKINGLSFLEESKENVKAENENRRFSADLLAEYQREQLSPKSSDSSAKVQELQDYRKKRSFKFTVPYLSRKGSKSTLVDDIPQKGDDLFKASDINGMENNVFEDYSQLRKSPVQRVSPIIQRDSKGLKDAEKGGDLFKAGDIADDDWTEKYNMDSKKEKVKKGRLPSRESKARDQLCFPEDIEPSGATSGDYYLSEAAKLRKSPVQRVSPIIQIESKGLKEAEKGGDLFKAGDIADDDWTEKYNMDSKKEKVKKGRLPSRESKARDQLCFPEDIEPPGATSGDYYLSEAAKAEWMSSQMDVRRARALNEDEELEAVKEEVDGDTDSLMEWWSTVELWDELPSDEELSLKEDETKSFTEIAEKVHQGLRVFYKVFTEHAEVLYQHVLRLYTISDDISNYHRRAKIANITGGTTTAVGGVAAITGLALAPVTFGASLIVSAVGLGVATAGGITAASASISDNVHDMNDRKKIEVVVQDYETRLAELRRSLRFVAEGVRRMRFHPLLRRNNYYAGDWEVRRALQTISLVGDPVEHAEDIVEKSTVALKSVCKGIDSYFSKDLKELKKGCKKEVTMQVNMLAKLLHEDLVMLNSMREQLMEAMGHV